MMYEELGPISRADAERELASGVRDRVCRALLRVALFHEDRSWIEKTLLRYLDDDDPWTRGVAATCVGHLARIHRTVDLTLLLPRLKSLLADPQAGAKARDALDDIRMFVADAEP